MKECTCANMAFPSFPLSTLIALTLLVASVQSNFLYGFASHIDDHSRTFQERSQNQALVDLDVYLGSSSCILTLIFLSKMTWYFKKNMMPAK
ncbi:hypothetical protein MHYP_G00235750 [Metynnis hypsauchen]